MEEIYEQNMEILKRATSKATQDVLKLYDLPYFDKKNYEENKSTLKFILALGDEGEFLSDDQVAIYVASTNSIYLKDSLLHKTLIDEEVLRMILLHELIHMASTDRKKGRVGFETDAFPITYNEGCTQFLTLKVLDKKIEENIMYPESTKYVKEVIDSLGEEKIFNGFFEAKPRKSVDGFTPKELDNWIDTIMALTRSLEEQRAKEGIKTINDQIEEYRNEKSSGQRNI